LEFTYPLLLLHGIDDNKIPLLHSQQMYKAASEKSPSRVVQLVEIERSGHEANYKFAKWLKEVPLFVSNLENNSNY
jgi:dipeptidyl aminopeptidase/acylaminoacyl peptidase